MHKSLTLIALAISVQGLCQKEVVSAYNANKEGDFATAATYIEQAIQNPKANVKNKTWRYRGEIYLNISRDSALFAAYPDALVRSKDSYMKAQELDTKGSYASEIQVGLGQVQMAASNTGIGMYNTGDFGSAGAFFDLSAEIASAFEATDTMAIYNSALCYEKAGEVDLAVARYRACADIEYQVPNVFLFISNLYRENGREAEALETLAEARGLYPREQSLIIEELNIYLTNEEFDKAKENLALAAAQDPTNEILWFSLGSVLDNLGNADEAIEAYGKALDVKPNYFDANYNLGALYFNRAVESFNVANDMWSPRMTKTQAASQKAEETKSKELFRAALPYLLDANCSKPNDAETLRSLKDCLARTGEDDLFAKASSNLKLVQSGDSDLSPVGDCSRFEALKNAAAENVEREQSIDNLNAALDAWVSEMHALCAEDFPDLESDNPWSSYVNCSGDSVVNTYFLDENYQNCLFGSPPFEGFQDLLDRLGYDILRARRDIAWNNWSEGGFTVTHCEPSDSQWSPSEAVRMDGALKFQDLSNECLTFEIALITVHYFGDGTEGSFNAPFLWLNRNRVYMLDAR
ncbi:MAG: tetratricopeptide repeat protein [Bacteroidota bacterium]|nr:tetratricopeptide repeat protein [Bacteroidota bacterium]